MGEFPIIDKALPRCIKKDTVDSQGSVFIPTYKEIQEWGKRDLGVIIQTCWIAEVKREMGLTKGAAPNRGLGDYAKPCPPKYKSAIREYLSEK